MTVGVEVCRILQQESTYREVAVGKICLCIETGREREGCVVYFYFLYLILSAYRVRRDECVDS